MIACFTSCDWSLPFPVASVGHWKSLAREVVRYLERAVAQSDLLRRGLQGLGPEEGVVKRVEALLRGLRTIMISARASSLIDKTRAVCASLGSSGVSAKDITGAAGLLLDELQPLREAGEVILLSSLYRLNRVVQSVLFAIEEGCHALTVSPTGAMRYNIPHELPRRREGTSIIFACDHRR